MSGNGYNSPSNGSDTETTNVGALADGLLASAINDPDTSGGSTAYVGGVANGDDRGNTETNTTNNTDNSQDHSVDVDADVDLALANGNNRDNEYDWSYDSKTITSTDIKTTNITDTDVRSDYDWSYDSKSYSDNDIITKTDTDIKTITDTDVKTTTNTDSFNTADSFNKTDTDIKTVTDSFNSSDDDFATLDHVKDFDNLGIAGGDVNFNLGDNLSFTLDVDNILNSSLGGGGTVFNAIQANHLADQDSASNIKWNSSDAHNDLSADGGKAYGHEGIDIGGAGWAGGAGDDVTGASSADASAILANSGFHFEFVQGANMLSNVFDAVGHDSSSIGQDSSDAAAAG